MSTRSLVFLQNKDESYDGISCNYDGQVEAGVGEILFDNYATFSDVRELINMGDASSIEEDIYESVFFCRDKDDDFNMYEVDDDEELENTIFNSDVSFVYLFKSNKWIFAENDGSGEINWKDLEDEF